MRSVVSERAASGTNVAHSNPPKVFAHQSLPLQFYGPPSSMPVLLMNILCRASRLTRTYATSRYKQRGDIPAVVVLLFAIIAPEWARLLERAVATLSIAVFTYSAVGSELTQLGDELKHAAACVIPSNPCDYDQFSRSEPAQASYPRTMHICVSVAAFVAQVNTFLCYGI